MSTPEMMKEIGAQWRRMRARDRKVYDKVADEGTYLSDFRLKI